MSAALEWQAFGSSNTAHLVDADTPAPKRSGPRSLCKRYPGRNYHAWFALPAAEISGPLPYELHKCTHCANHPAYMQEPAPQS